MNILVVGSSNVDMVARMKSLPISGQTVGNANFYQTLGGKGANQAIAAARLGGKVSFVTSLGNDMYSEILLEQFKNDGINVDSIFIDKEKPTGVALIMVSESAENFIAVAPGANYSLSPDKIEQFKNLLNTTDLLVMQAEIPYETTKRLALLAKQNNVKVMYNPAPACLIDAEFMNAIDILVVNENEAEYISGMSLTKFSSEEIAAFLLKQGAKQVVMTLGSKGAFFISMEKSLHIDSFDVKAVDTTAAGDTFCGALAASCGAKHINEYDLIFASASAAISVTRFGAQPSIPHLQEVKDFLRNNK